MHNYTAQPSTQILTVSQLNRKAKQLLENEFTNIRLSGEVSGVVFARSGHIYFRLKDKKSEIDCAFFKRYQWNLKKNKPENGLEVILTGSVTLYIARGNYQFIVEDLKRKDKKGDIYRAFEELKVKLRKKGYFEEDRKLSIPPHPKCVGIITSQVGAAVQDIIRTFERRNPSISLLIYPVLVQGDGSAEQIAEAINLANDRNEVDVLILARGGGSIEDLWSFNDEKVANAIMKSKTPIVTGIGHQTDRTIADYVADYEAATPTAAAERLSTPSKDELLKDLSNWEDKLTTRIQQHLDGCNQRIDIAQKGLIHPNQRIENMQGEFKIQFTRLEHMITNLVFNRHTRLNNELQQLLGRTPNIQINEQNSILRSREELLHVYMNQLNERHISRVESMASRLEAVNPRATVKRGYAIIRRVDDNSIVYSANVTQVGEKVKAELAEGELICEIESVKT